MIFETDHIYHIFNQGNDKRQIFFTPGNYLFFLGKIKTHIIPFADILAWCLMPNHFHLMVLIKDTHRVTWSSDSFTQSEAITKTKSLNNEIGLMHRSYTRAINIQENRSGYLFKAHTKAQCLTQTNGVTPSFYNTKSGTIINVPNPEKDYPQTCFKYIHNNPVEAGLVKNPEDWEYSSYRDYCGMRNGKLINKEKAKECKLLIQ